MNTCKFVYVLTSSTDDTYYEQFLLSATSLRLHNPNAHIVALIDSKTKQNLTGSRVEYEKIITEIQVISPPVEFSQKEASRWIKTSIHRYVSGDFIFIDCDTVITGIIVPDFSFDIQIGAVLDTHVPLSSHHLKNDFIRQKLKAGFTRQFDFLNYFNSGIIFCRYTPETKNFFEQWHKLWIESNKNGVSADQPSFNQADYETNNIISELPGEWNCQISFNGLPYLHNAKIIHYYATSLVTQVSPFIPASEQVLHTIKETATIPDDILELLKNPRTAFNPETRIIAGGEALDVVNSNLFAKILWLRKKRQGVFNRLNRLSLLVKNPKHKKK